MFDAFSEYMNFKVQNRYDIKLDIVGEDAIVGTYLHQTPIYIWPAI